MSQSKIRVAFKLAMASLLGIASMGSAATLIDFNMSGRGDAEVNEPGWNPWVVAAATTDSKTFSGVTFALSMAGTSGTNLNSTWYKAGVAAPNYARLVGDGLHVEGGNSGGAIKLVLSGLTAGTHTLLAYHNAVDGNTWAQVNVDVDGVRKITNLQPTNRALTTDASAITYVTFSATSGKSVTILYSPNSSSSSSYKNVIINALALDVPNPVAMAKGESPEDRDWHVDADAGSVTLSWTAAKTAVSHGVYFGTDSSGVSKATTTSGQYMGKQTGATYKVTGLSNLKTYWWRVDETDASGVVTKGNIWGFSPRHLAFPGAEGYGRYARGGRGGKVVHVTNLDDAGAGSLRAAVETDIGPRTIVFDVSGIITLKSRLTLSSNNVTLAGQTAPGKGIVVRSCPFGLSGVNDNIIRFLKVRLGYTGLTWDGTGLQGANHTIMDHASVSWTIDESFSSRSGKNITLQRTLISEALNVANHQNYPAGTMHGYAATISGDVGSFHHNLLAHNDGRNWSFGGGLDGNGYYAGRLDVFNNVVYNWNDRASDGGAHEVNFVGNYYKPGAATKYKMALNNQWDGFPGTQQYYCHGNIVKGTFDDSTKANNGCTSSTGTASVVNPDPWVTKPFFASYATVQTAAEAYKDVLSDVGMTMPVFDDHDQRMVKETYNGTYTYKGSVSGLPGLIDRESDQGGYESYPSTSRAVGFDTDADGLPDWYETYIGTSTKSASGDFSNANADPVGDGYTNLERYLDYMATPHAEAKVSNSVTFNLASLFRGYANAPSYSAGSNSCLTTTIVDSVLTVTPKSACGIASLPLTVKDKEGSTKTRCVAVFVTGSTSGVSVAGELRRPLEWSVGSSVLELRTDMAGTLSLRDLSGRVLGQVTGTGTLELGLAQCPRGILVASFQAPGFQEKHLFQVFR